MGKHEVPGSDASYRGPEHVKSVPRLERDIKALTQLTLPPRPPLVVVRNIKSLLFLYGFGDASWSGFGFLSQFGGSDIINYEYGQWPFTVASETSSNYKEFTNMVDSIEGLAIGGQLYGVKAFCGVDNMFTDRAFYKGYSTSEVLDAEVLRLRTLELTYGFKLHMFHIAGIRMIATGTDGVSRGDKTTGARIGKPLASFMPLHLTAFERSPALETWIREVTHDLKPQVLTPEGWFTDGHTFRNSIWVPPPAAADVVVGLSGMLSHE